MNLRLPLFVVVLALLTTAAVAQKLSPEEMKKWAEQDRQRLANQTFLNQVMQIAFNRELQAEIKADEFQIQMLRETVAVYQRNMQEFNNKYREDLREISKLAKAGEHALAREMAIEFHAKQAEVAGVMMDAATAILKEEQTNRLKQISKQNAARLVNPFRDEFGVVYALADDLELTEDQKQRLRATIEEVRKEYYEQVAELKEKANQQILDAIPADKRDRLKEILGDRYDQEQRSRLAANEARKKQEELLKARQQQAKEAAEKAAQGE